MRIMFHIFIQKKKSKKWLTQIRFSLKSTTMGKFTKYTRTKLST